MTSGTERRTDPRNDARFSLRNLLSVRASRQGLPLAVLGTADGVLMAGSSEDRAAQRTAAHAAFELARSADGRWSRPGRDAWELSALRFQQGGEKLCLAVLARSSTPRRTLEELASRVQAILSEVAPPRGARAQAA